MALAIFLVICYGAYCKTGNPLYLQMFRFWRRIFGIPGLDIPGIDIVSLARGYGCHAARADTLRHFGNGIARVIRS